MVTQPTTVLPPQPRKCGGVHTPQVQKLLTGHKSWKSYCATTEGLVSSSCEGVVLDGAQCCASCFALLKDKALQKRIKRQPRMRYLATTNQCNLDVTISKFTRHDYVTHNQLLQRSQHLGQQRRQDFFTVRKHIRVADKATRDWKIAKAKMLSSANTGNGVKYLRSYNLAAETNIFPKEALQDILLDIGKSLTLDKQRFNLTSRSFYVTLLNSSSPSIVKYVSRILQGPHLRTVQNWRSQMSFNLEPGMREDNLDNLVTLLKAYNLDHVPGIWSEDATTNLKRLSVSLSDNETGIEVILEGFVEPIRIRSLEELDTAFNQYGSQGLASYVYVWTWFPQAPHAPYFPVIWKASNNRFKASNVWNDWMWLFEQGAKRGLKAIGSVADGDSRLRKCQYELNVHNTMKAPTTTLNHPLMFMHITMLFDKPMLGFQDWLHCAAFRGRRLLCDKTHNFQMNDSFGADAGSQHLHAMLGGYLSEKDLDPHEKQHWQGCLRLFSTQTIKHLEQRLTLGEDAVRGTLAYLMFMNRLLNCYIGPQSGADATDREQAVIDASFCCAFALYWRYRVVQLKDKQFNLKKHFLTRETFLDILTMTQTRILLVVLYRQWYPEFKIHAPNVSSRVSEYVFQYCRMHETNSPLFDVAGFRRHLKHFVLQMQLGIHSNIDMPPSKRGMPNSVRRVQPETFSAPEGWHLSDAELSVAIDKGIVECVELWKGVLQCNHLTNCDLSDPKHFFATLMEHFRTQDMCSKGVFTDEDEDVDGLLHDRDLEFEDREMDVAQAVNITEQLGDILQKQGLVGVPIPEDRMQFYKQMSGAVSTWNQGVKQAKSDRALRFMEEQAFRNTGTCAEDADKWDYLSEDDDVLIVEQVQEPDAEGKQQPRDLFILANVVDQAILKKGNPKRKTRLEEVDLMQKEPRLKIPINLEEGALFLRKYREANAEGNILEGYQNPTRGAQGREAQKYYVSPQVANEPLQWWPASAILGHVRMTKVEGIELCYNKNKRDFDDLVQLHHRNLQTRSEPCYCVACIPRKPKVRPKKRAMRTPRAMHRSYALGDTVQAKYRGAGRALYAGVITAVNVDGTYDVDYKDGTSQAKVLSRDIRPVHDDHDKDNDGDDSEVAVQPIEDHCTEPSEDDSEVSVEPSEDDSTEPIEEDKAEQLHYDGFVVGARLKHGPYQDSPQLQYLIYWDNFAVHMCTYEPYHNWICNATEMELDVTTKFMLVHCGSLRQCKFVCIIDDNIVQLEWYRVPQPTMEKRFNFHLRDMYKGVTEWSLYGYDEDN